jgi:hypothetical protein
MVKKFREAADGVFGPLVTKGRADPVPKTLTVGKRR